MSFAIQSPKFRPDGSIPSDFTCEGEDRAPPLVISGVPPEAKSLVLIVDDPDAPDPAAPKRTFVHWVVYDLPPSTKELPEGGALPKGAREGRSDFGRTGYGGPCPPVGRHRYYFKLYALDTVLGDLGAATKAKVETAMRGHVLAQAELVGTYQKQKA